MENLDKVKNTEIKPDNSQGEKSPEKPIEVRTKVAPAKKIMLNQDDFEKMRLMGEDVDFVSDSKAALVAKHIPFITTTLVITAALIFVGIIWASVTHLDEIIQGIGKVVPSSQVQVIQNLEGGILSKLYVKEGQIVKKGQILVQLDGTIFTSQYREGYAKWLAIQATIARLTAQTEYKDAINFPPEILKVPELVKRETDLFNSQQESMREGLENLRYGYKLANEELQIVSPLVDKGVISKIELLRLQRDLTAIKGKIDGYENDVYERYFAELTKAQEDSNALVEGLAGLKDRMQRTTMISPVNGVIKQIYLNTVGGVLRSAIPIMEVVPLNDQLLIEARIRPADIGFITIGQKAKIKITAYDYAVYGDLSAVVTNIGADTLTDERGNSFYEVTLKTDKSYLGSKVGVFPIIPGMMATVDIMIGKKSMMTYIMKPIIRAKEKAMRER